MWLLSTKVCSTVVPAPYEDSTSIYVSSATPADCTVWKAELSTAVTTSAFAIWDFLLAIEYCNSFDLSSTHLNHTSLQQDHLSHKSDISSELQSKTFSASFRQMFPAWDASKSLFIVRLDTEFKKQLFGKLNAVLPYTSSKFFFITVLSHPLQSQRFLTLY